MARRSQRRSQPGSAETRDQGRHARPERAAEFPTGAAQAEIAVARVAEEIVGFRLADVAEIIRVPRLAHMPLAPQSLLGLGNLRGEVLPVISLRRLLKLDEAALDEAARVVVIGGRAPVGFAVDLVESLRAVPAVLIEVERAGAGRLDPGVVAGVIKGSEGQDTVKILDPERLLQADFRWLNVAAATSSASITIAGEAAAVIPEAEKQIALLSVCLDHQEYGFPLERVREIIHMPEHISEIAGAETAVLGVMTLRGRLLPLVSLRALLGLPSGEPREERGKVVVVSMGESSVGVVTDRTNAILRVGPDEIDPAPALLTRGAGEAEIDSICRLDGGSRIVALLSPDRLFRSELVRRVLSETARNGGGADDETAGGAMADEQFLIFRLGEQEYGLPITAVHEVAPAPERITRLPKAPAFVDGVINLRGLVVPIIDLRRRFDLAPQELGAARRILVLAIGGGQTGFMVNDVSEVLRIAAEAIRPAPELSSEQFRLIGRVANLEAQGRMILLLDPERLLDQIEADMLANFDRSKPAAASIAS